MFCAEGQSQAQSGPNRCVGACTASGTPLGQPTIRGPSENLSLLLLPCSACVGQGAVQEGTGVASRGQDADDPSAWSPASLGTAAAHTDVPTDRVLGTHWLCEAWRHSPWEVPMAGLQKCGDTSREGYAARASRDRVREPQTQLSGSPQSAGTCSVPDPGTPTTESHRPAPPGALRPPAGAALLLLRRGLFSGSGEALGERTVSRPPGGLQHLD